MFLLIKLNIPQFFSWQKIRLTFSLQVKILGFYDEFSSLKTCSNTTGTYANRQSFCKVSYVLKIVIIRCTINFDKSRSLALRTSNHFLKRFRVFCLWDRKGLIYSQMIIFCPVFFPLLSLINHFPSNFKFSLNARRALAILLIMNKLKIKTCQRLSTWRKFVLSY